MEERPDPPLTELVLVLTAGMTAGRGAAGMTAATAGRAAVTRVVVWVLLPLIAFWTADPICGWMAARIWAMRADWDRPLLEEEVVVVVEVVCWAAAAAAAA